MTKEYTPLISIGQVIVFLFAAYFGFLLEVNALFFCLSCSLLPACPPSVGGRQKMLQRKKIPPCLMSRVTFHFFTKYCVAIVWHLSKKKNYKKCRNIKGCFVFLLILTWRELQTETKKFDKMWHHADVS